MDGSKTSSSRNHALWLAPVLAVGALLSYFVFFSQYPAFRDTAWLNLLGLAVSVGLGFVAMKQAWPRGGWRRVAAVAGLFVASAATGMLLFYTQWLSYGLPDAELSATPGERVPTIALASTEGGTLDLASAGAGRLVLVFYRGFW